jgi:hypothetical protein
MLHRFSHDVRSAKSPSIAVGHNCDGHESRDEYAGGGEGETCD